MVRTDSMLSTVALLALSACAHPGAVAPTPSQEDNAIVDPYRNSEPMDRSLAERFEYRHIQLDPDEQMQFQALVEQVKQAADKSLGATKAAPLRPAQADVLADQRLRAPAVGDDEGVRAASLAFGEMESPPQQPPIPPVVTSGELSPLGDPAIRARMNFKPIEWPLRFRTHQFDMRCHDTLTCEVVYADFRHTDYKPTRPSAEYGPDYLKGWNGSHINIQNFPPPAKVTWRSRDGTAHEARIDIGALFKDERILHYVPREEVADAPDGTYDHEPSILLEINDRTIRLYMLAFVPTKHLQVPGDRLSGVREDLILVKTYTY